MSKINRASICSKLNYCQQLWPVLRNAQVRTVLTVAAVLSIIVIYQSGMLMDADALTRYFNCTTRAANKNGTLSLQNVDNCYDNVFKGAKSAEKELQALKVGTTSK
ncbi:MAG: hypothetical protein WBW34_08965 [Nitrososphaeraceae archaeon]